MGHLLTERSERTIARDMQTRLISFRILNRNYWTPAKMSRLRLRENDKCLWMAVIQCINKVLKVEFREGPAPCILGILPRKSGLFTQICTWVKLPLATGNRVVLRHWTSEEGISFIEWRDELTKIASFEQLIYKINNN